MVRNWLAGDIGELCRDLERCQSYASGLMQNIYHRLYKVEYLFFCLHYDHHLGRDIIRCTHVKKQPSKYKL
jgi:hypothetical protein